jgi:hypothetical protein
MRFKWYGWVGLGIVLMFQFLKRALRGGVLWQHDERRVVAG